MILESPLHIDGTVEGEIESSNDVSIGAEGSFDGSLRARHVVVTGYVHGKIDCVRLEIVPKGKVFGEVVSDDFVIEAGGQFVGESHIKANQPSTALDHLDDRAGAPARISAAFDEV